MLTIDEETLDILIEIYSTPVKEEERQVLDNKAVCVNQMWEKLAYKYISDEFKPESSWACTTPSFFLLIR